MPRGRDFVSGLRAFVRSGRSSEVVEKQTLRLRSCFPAVQGFRHPKVCQGRFALLLSTSNTHTIMADVGEDTNAYQILDIKVDATEKEIKKAYRLKSITVHPDKVNVL
jgi:hypothetical protein